MKYKYITGKVIIKNFGNHTDFDGETEGYGEFDFKLKEPLVFQAFGVTYKFDRITYYVNHWSAPLYYSGRGKTHGELPIPTKVAREIHEALSAAEQGKGKLKGWCFSDDLEKQAYPERFDERGWRKR